MRRSPRSTFGRDMHVGLAEQRIEMGGYEGQILYMSDFLALAHSQYQVIEEELDTTWKVIEKEEAERM